MASGEEPRNVGCRTARTLRPGDATAAGRDVTPRPVETAVLSWRSLADEIGRAAFRSCDGRTGLQVVEHASRRTVTDVIEDALRSRLAQLIPDRLGFGRSASDRKRDGNQ